MNLQINAAAVSSDRLLSSLYLAIDEARVSRSLIKSRNRIVTLDKDGPLSEKLVKLNKEINYLEAKLIQVRSTTKQY